MARTVSKPRALGGIEEWLDFQVLLDPFEKQFDLRNGLVDGAHGLCRQFHVVVQDLILLAGF